MYSNKNIDYIVDTSEIKKDSCGRCQWLKSIGSNIYITYNNENFTLNIYNAFKDKKQTKIDIVFDDQHYIMQPSRDLYSTFKNILKNKYSQVNYKYSIGDTINNIEIINRIYNKMNYGNKMKWYECKCIKCGYNHFWKTEYELNTEYGCPVCTGRKVKKGINDIATTSPWMIEYFINKDDAYKYTCNSNKKLYMKCPFCGRKSDNKIIINNLHKRKGFQCICSDGISYPNKFIYKFVEQLNVENIIREYSPDWLGLRKFDIYFEFENKKYVIEMDGGLGHGRIKYASKDKDEIGLKTDREKDILAKQHNIHVIRLDAQKSELEYLKYNIEKSILSKTFNLSEIDWINCEKFARSNLIKTICDEYESDIFISHEILSKKYNLSCRTIINYINIGRKIGWISSNQKDNIRTRIIRYTPLLVNDKYYFSCLKSFKENGVDIFKLDSINTSSLSRRLKIGSIIYKGLKLEYIDKNSFEEKYRNHYRYIYL